MFVDVGLDLQVIICSFLHPADILALRKTCKTLQLATMQRIIWVDALQRVCQDNSLFLPSFPILDMSDVELEHAAIGPRRWIELSKSFAAHERTGSNSEDKVLSPTTRIFDDPLEISRVDEWDETDLILVPGGRYMVACSRTRVGVWDLGYKSSCDCKLIASIAPEVNFYAGIVNPTRDGLGLVICSFVLHQGCPFYEIYPQSETPQFTQIALLDTSPEEVTQGYVSSDKVLWYASHPRQLILRVWDYRLNTSGSFQIGMEEDTYNVKTIATQTAIVVLAKEAVLIFDIPPLSPHAPNFDDHNHILLSPQIRVNFPTAFTRPFHATWEVISSWYFGSSQPLYFDKVYRKDGEVLRFKLVIKPDLSDATLHPITALPSLHSGHEFMVCEDILVSSRNTPERHGIYIISHSINTTLHGDIKMLLPTPRSSISSGPICPASGRFVYIQATDAHQIVVCDFLPH